MKRNIVLAALFSLVQLFCGANALGQITYTAPQTVISTNFFSAQAAPVVSSAFTNLGQTIHFVFYTVAGSPTTIDIVMEGSYDNSTFFQISDDATDLVQGEIVAIGDYPFVRANLKVCGGCSAQNTVTASYSGTSATPSSPYGFYNPSQQVRKVITTAQSTSGNNGGLALGVPAPYGSLAGFLVITSQATFSGNATFTIKPKWHGQTGNGTVVTMPNSAPVQVVFPMPSTPATSLDVSYNHGTTGAGTFNATYYFLPPGAALPASVQPPQANNKEATATNGTASVTLAPSGGQSAYVFSVSGRCGAGTSQLLVVDTTTSTNLWTSGTTEVGTTTFKYQWNPGLVAAAGDTIQVQLTTCGVGNVGTLDVQGSVL